MLIDTKEFFKCETCRHHRYYGCNTFCDAGEAYSPNISKLTAVDAVEIEAIRAWLYEIAMNNTDNYLCDACEEIISRLDGLRVFARERKENEEKER